MMQRYYSFFVCFILASCAADESTVQLPPPDVAQHRNDDRPLAEAPVIPQYLVYDQPLAQASVIPLPSQNATEPPTASELSADNPFVLTIGEEKYAVSPAIGAGSFGFFRLAVDAQGHPWGIKQLALPSPAKGLLSQPLPTTEAEIRQEFGLAKYVLGDRLDIRHIAQSGEKAFVVMTLWDGSFANLRAYHRDATDTLRGMIASVSHDAVRLHEAGYIHNDIRSQNILWNASGDIALWDFGLARAVESDGMLERVPFKLHDHLGYGTRVNEAIMAPEVDAERYTHKADTWSLGLAALAEFSIEEDDRLLEQACVELVYHKPAYAQWYESLKSTMPGVSCDGIAHPDTVTISPRHWYFAAIYHELNQRDPQLCNLLLQGMLVPDPTQRWDMRQVEAYARKLATPPVTREVQSNLSLEHQENDQRARTLEGLRSIMDCVHHDSNVSTCAPSL